MSRSQGAPQTEQHPFSLLHAFTMGSTRATDPDRDADEGPLTRVTLTKGYWIFRNEVTQGQFQAIMGYNPSRFQTCGRNCPVETVSWHEAAAFCNALSV